MKLTLPALYIYIIKRYLYIFMKLTLPFVDVHVYIYLFFSRCTSPSLIKLIFPAVEVYVFQTYNFTKLTLAASNISFQDNMKCQSIAFCHKLTSTDLAANNTANFATYHYNFVFGVLFFLFFFLFRICLIFLLIIIADCPFLGINIF